MAHYGRGNPALLGSSSAEDGRGRSAAGQSQFQTHGPIPSFVKNRTGPDPAVPSVEAPRIVPFKS